MTPVERLGVAISDLGIAWPNELRNAWEAALKAETKESKMETFIQPKITGYRQLTEAEASLMNEGKALAEACGEYVKKLHGLGTTIDQRWVSIGATQLQQGFMSVIRGIAQPTTF